jgi:hypothetical protein
VKFRLLSGVVMSGPHGRRRMRMGTSSDVSVADLKFPFPSRTSAAEVLKPG